MSTNHRYTGDASFAISATDKNGFVECQKEKCALWIGVLCMGGNKPEGYEYGCAFAIAAQKNNAGYIPV